MDKTAFKWNYVTLESVSFKTTEDGRITDSAIFEALGTTKTMILFGTLAYGGKQLKELYTPEELRQFVRQMDRVIQGKKDWQV